MLTIFLLAALLIFLLSIDLGWSNVLTSDRNDLVFQERNHDYGAYALRREHHVNLFYAMLLSVGLIAGTCYLLSSVCNSAPIKVPDQVITLMDITPFELIDKPEPLENPAPQRAVAASPPANDTEVEVVQQPIEEVPVLNIPPSIGPIDPTAQPGEVRQGPTGGGGTGTSNNTENTTSNFVFDVVQKMPIFPGGETALMDFIRSHVEYDEMSKERGIQGTIYVSFVVMADGRVDKIEIIRGITNGQQLAKNVTSTIQKLPRWEPGIQNGVPVPVRKTIPVKFELRNS